MLAGGLDTLLEADGLVAGFHGRDPVLQGARFAVSAGRRVALLGANGSGKTTLLRCLSGALTPISGTILAKGQPLERNKAALRSHRRFVQLVLQDPDDQLFSADVTQDVSFGPMNLGLGAQKAWNRVEQALELLSITQLADRPTHQLSYGERKRVAIAGAVAMRPEVLLLDEPTAGLDPAGVAELLVTLAGLESTVVLATHDVDLALGWADEVAIVGQGQVRQSDPTLLADEELLRTARLRRPWQLALASRLGFGIDPLPRTVEEVAAMIESRAD